VKLSLVESTAGGNYCRSDLVYVLLTVSVGRFEWSLIGSVVSTATSGFQELWVQQQQPLALMLPKTRLCLLQRQSQPQSAIASGINLTLSGIRYRVLWGLCSCNDLNDIRGQFEKILGGADLQSLAGSDLLKTLTARRFVDLAVAELFY